MSSKKQQPDQKPRSKMITLWVPNSLNAALKAAVANKETDKSKWIREAMREKAAREGLSH